MGSVMYLAMAFSACFVAIAMGLWSGSRRLNILIGWTGLLVPIAVAPSLMGFAEYANDPRGLGDVGLAEMLLRGAVPIIAIVAMVVINSDVVRRPFDTRELALGIFSGIIIASSLWAPSFEVSFLRGVQLVALYGVLILLVRSYSFTDRSILADTVILLVVIVASVLFSAVAMGEQAWQMVAQGQSRLTGVAPRVHPNALGMISVVVVLAMLLRTGPSWIIRHWPVRLTIALLGSLALWFSVARGALVLLAFGIALSVLWSGSARLSLLSVVTIVASIVLLVGVDAYGERFEEYAARGQTQDQLLSMTGRTQKWELAYDLWRERPFLGSGFYSHRHGEFFEIRRRGSNVDNMWLEVMHNVGILGTIPLAVFVSLGLAKGWRERSTIRRQHGGYSAAHFRWIALWVMLLASLINPSLQAPNYWLIVFGILLLSGPRHPNLRTEMRESEATVDHPRIEALTRRRGCPY